LLGRSDGLSGVRQAARAHLQNRGCEHAGSRPADLPQDAGQIRGAVQVTSVDAKQGEWPGAGCEPAGPYP